MEGGWWQGASPRLRCTADPTLADAELLERLLALNHQRASSASAEIGFQIEDRPSGESAELPVSCTYISNYYRLS